MTKSSVKTKSTEIVPRSDDDEFPSPKERVPFVPNQQLKSNMKVIRTTK